MGVLSIGIIGTGFGGKVHVPAFRNVPDVEVTGIAGRDTDKAKHIARVQDIPLTYHSWQELVDDKNISAVVVAVPPAFQYDIVMQALKAGKHVLCEKPFGLDSDQAARMLDRSLDAGRVCMVDYMFRLSPERIRLKTLLAEQAIGRILRIDVEWTVRGRAAGSSEWSWQFDPSSGGGVLLAFGSHVVDYLQWLIGPIQAVSTHLSTRGKPTETVPPHRPIAEDTLDAIMLAGDHIPVSVTVSNAIPGGRGHWLTICGERGVLVVGNPNLRDAVIGTRLYQGSPEANDLREIEVPSINDPEMADGRTWLVHRLAEVFVRAISSDRAVSPSFEDGWRAQVVMDAMRQSHEQRCWVSVGSGSGHAPSGTQARRLP